MVIKLHFILILFFLSPLLSRAQVQEKENVEFSPKPKEEKALRNKKPVFEMPDISVLGGRDDFFEPGSVQVVGSEELKEKQTTDPHEALSGVTGLYVREEEGFGLRPNIGLRGALSNRSSKITLMEDGVLIAPAPYSAPAAYYFPLMQKIDSIEVFKGPATVKYGPNSIGGALNFLTRPFKKDRGQVSLRYGSYNTVQLSTHHQKTFGRLKVMAEAHRWQSDGFKTLPDGGNTGFDRNDVTLKTRYDVLGDQSTLVDFKLNWANEVSRETYLGTTIDDFNSNTYGRYAASQNDVMDFEFWSKELRIFSQWNESISVQTTLYRHDFGRTWAKFDRFVDDSVDVQNVLLNPTGANEDFYRVLTGQQDSTSTEQLRYGINARDYYSQGVGLETDISLFEKDSSALKLELGLLWHQDLIDRNHTFQNYNMIGGRPIFVGEEQTDSANQEIDTSDVFRTFGRIEYQVSDLILHYGLRYESVASRRNNKLDTGRLFRQDDIVVDGLGASYALSNHQVLYTGVFRGITLPGPGEVAQVEPEESWNYEIGYRLNHPIYFELAGFYSDYENLLGTCTFSGGCTNTELDQQFNSGAVDIYGLEAQLGGELNKQGFRIPIQISSTYTEASFREEIESSNKVWGQGTIQEGAPIPYIPQVKSTLTSGLKTDDWSALLNLTHQTSMYDQAVEEDRQEVDAYWVLGFSGRYSISKAWETNLRIQNLTNEQYIVSLRPFGARPGAPFMAHLGFSYSY